MTSFALNDAQQRAVDHDGGALLVIAGAGSGKTRVLTARVARLLERGVPPRAILAFTFTNRAAREMRERLERTVGADAGALWVGTFHATCVRILRREARELGLPPGFAIYDREDQEGVIRDLIRRLELPEGAWRVGTVLSRISDAKNALVPPGEVERLAVSPWEKRLAELYALYQDALRRNGALDFDDLIAETVRLMKDRADVEARWAGRFEHVLVDEYQDTNHAQFRLVQGLARGHGNLFVVGDDDQSIYGWRGADLSNVLEFEAAFPGAEVVRLEQNYRSTNNILRAANAVIANNRERKGKNLWSEREDGPRLKFALLADETEEASRIRRLLEERLRRGGRLDDVAILYRTNAQSRALETELRRCGLPYEIVGGISFFQRREVKDLIAYLRAVVNPADAVAFFRIWNTPRRGLGPAVRAQVEDRMRRDLSTAEQALRTVRDEGGLASRPARDGASALLDLLQRLRAMEEQPADAVFRELLQSSGYLRELENGEAEDADRRANVEELVASAQAFVLEHGGTLADFLAEAALLTDADRRVAGDDRALLLTAHNAKGLEFPMVVVAGLEEGLLPHASALEDGRGLEEERRLFYVALTRARDEVLLTAAAFRRRFDQARGGQVSRFVDEIPASLLDREASPAVGRPHALAGSGGRRGWDRDDEGSTHGQRAASWTPPPSRPRGRHRAIGREVYHEIFGRGRVLEAEGEGGDARFTVQFNVGVKKVLGRFLSGGADADPA